MKKLQKPSLKVDKEKMRERVRRGAILFIVAVFLVGGIGVYLFAVFSNDSNGSGQTTDNTEVQEEVDPSMIISGDITGLKKIDIKEGTGKTVKKGDTISVAYKGALAKNGQIFDQSSVPIEIGLDGVIEGWKNGIPGMKVGGKRKLIIPADLAYGKTGTPDGSIPPNSPLVFEVEVKDIVEK